MAQLVAGNAVVSLSHTVWHTAIPGFVPSSFHDIAYQEPDVQVSFINPVCSCKPLSQMNEGVGVRICENWRVACSRIAAISDTAADTGMQGSAEEDPDRHRPFRGVAFPAGCTEVSIVGSEPKKRSVLAISVVFPSLPTAG